MKKHKLTPFEVFVKRLREQSKRTVIKGLSKVDAELLREHEQAEKVSKEEVPKWAIDLKKNLDGLIAVLEAKRQYRPAPEDYDPDEEEETDPFLKETNFTQEEIDLFSGKMDFSSKSEKKKTLLERINALHEKKFGKTKAKGKERCEEVYTTAEQKLHCRLQHLKESAYSATNPIPMSGLKTPKGKGSGFEEPRTEVIDQSTLVRPFKPEDRNTMDFLNQNNWGPESKELPLEKPDKQFEQKTPLKSTNEPVKSKQTVTQEELDKEARRQRREDGPVDLSKKDSGTRKPVSKDLARIMAKAKKQAKTRRYGSYKRALEMLHKEKKAVGKR